MARRPPPPPPYGPGQPPRKVKVVSKQRGLSAMSHGTHLMLTVVTCGFWGLLVWLPWWLFRLVFRRKRTTTYRYR